MIITITGKPCSGKGTVSKAFCKKYNFEYLCTGDMFREYAKEFGYDNILTFQQEDPRIKQIDKLVDENTINIGKTRANEDLLIDSRMAWHFIPNSFKVFIDVNERVAGERLFNAKRSSEQMNSVEDAITSLKDRWNVENSRYMELYGVNNLNLDNYDFVIDSSNLTPEQVMDEIYSAYLKFSQQKAR